MDAQLNRYLAGEYGIEPNNELIFRDWLDSHKPFHWFVQFYSILKSGGFDVIIGNPPYVEYSKVKKQYTVSKCKTEKCGNLYAMSIERSMDLAKGPISMIVQLPLVCTDRMIPAQALSKTATEKVGLPILMTVPGNFSMTYNTFAPPSSCPNKTKN